MVLLKELVQENLHELVIPRRTVSQQGSAENSLESGAFMR
jgi:hypothetical protein